MIFGISYFVIYSPKYIETGRHDNFYLGSMSALFQQLKHYYTCYFTTGDTRNIFGAVTLWPHVHKCWCRTKVCSTGAHTFRSTLTYLPGTSKNFYHAGRGCSLSFCLAMMGVWPQQVMERMKKLIPATHTVPLFHWVFLSHAANHLLHRWEKEWMQ